MNMSLLTLITKMNSIQGFDPGEQTIISTAGQIQWNLNGNQRAKITLSENTTLMNPSNQKAGCDYTLKVIQDTQARTLAFDNAYHPVVDLPILSTVPNSVNIFTFRSDGTDMYLLDYIPDARA